MATDRFDIVIANSVTAKMVNGEVADTKYASLNAALAAIGSTPTTLLVRTANFPLTGAAVVPSTMQIRLEYPGSIAGSTYALTLNGGIVVGSGCTISTSGAIAINSDYSFPSTRVFTGAGVVTGLEEAYPEWWGADNTGSADSTTAVNAAFTTSGNIVLSKGIYKGNFAFTTFGKVTGAGIGLTKLVPYNATDPIVTITQGSTAYSYMKGLGFVMRDLIIDGGQNHTAVDGSASTNSFTAQHGIRIYGGAATTDPNSSVGNVLIQHVAITACGGHGVYLDGLNTGTANIYSQVAWVKLDNITSTWNLGNGVRFAGSAFQTQITGASLIEKNARGCAKPASATVLNERAQVLVKAGNSGFPAVISIDGGTTIQSGPDGTAFTSVSGTYAAAVSNHGGLNISVNNCWIEGNDIGFASTSSVGKGFAIKDNYIKRSYSYGVLLSAGTGIKIDGNSFLQDSVGGVAIDADPSTSTDLNGVTIANNTYVDFTTNRDIGLLVKNVRVGDYGETAKRSVTYATAGATLTADLSIGKIVYVTLAHNITLTLSNPVVGEEYTIYLQQGTTANTVAWADTMHWKGASAPVITTTNNRTDCITLVYRSNASFYEKSIVTDIEN